jgi:hypothetical protein
VKLNFTILSLMRWSPIRARWSALLSLHASTTCRWRSHLDQRKLPVSLDSAIERGGELAARGNSFAHAADRSRDIGKVPIIEIVEARLRLEHPQCDVLAPAMFLRKRAHSQSPTTTPKRLEFGAKS